MARATKDKSFQNSCAHEILLINKIYESFEALEDTLGKLKLEEPLFITYMAKKSFADKVFNQIKHNHEKLQAQKYLN
uniref:Uncharacterized protein n=1 Tax=uncultured Alphaproteobacteria bacterium TaxID=91750 RepID=A0A6G8F2J5_9PROT|nr:hypothetical protein PlAlph_2940 [uncultured Alphaproteobacteria bacterium]